MYLHTSEEGESKGGSLKLGNGSRQIHAAVLSEAH